MRASESANPAIRVWRHRNYALFMIGLTPAATSSWMQRVGVGWLAWELTHSTVWLGAVAAADLAPILVLSPLAGALVDRMKPLNVLRVTQWLQFAQAAALAIATIAAFMTIELLFALALFLGIVSAFGSAARHATVPSTVPREEVATAVSLDSAFFQASRFIGPAIAALVIPWAGVAGTFLAHSVGTFFFALLMHAMDVPAPQRGRGRRRSLFADVGESVAYVRSHVGIWPLFVMLAAASVLVRPLQDMLPGFAGAVFHAGPAGLAWLTSAMGVGAMVSAARVAIYGRTSGLTAMCYVGAIVASLTTVAFAASGPLWLGVVFGALVGYFLNTLSTGVQALVQMAVEDSMRGRVMSLYTLVFRGMPTFGALAFGLAAEWVGLRATFISAGLICLVASLALTPHRARATRTLEGQDRSDASPV